MRHRILFLLFLCLPLSALADWQFDNVDRVVALSDIHGAHQAMVKTLQSADVIGEDQQWTGGRTNLVIVGDILDRGPDSRASMDLLIKLEQQADSSGGKVHVLIGNHEAMNLIGDMRYVAKEEFAAFASEESEEERAHWFALYAEKRANGEVTRAQFDQKFPAGYFAHRRAFMRGGKYGDWLLSKPLIVVINKTAFVHGGVSPFVAEYGLEGINGTLVGELGEYVRQLQVLFDAGILLPTDAFYDHPALLKSFLPGPNTATELISAAEAVTRLNGSRLHDSDGPMWYRGNVACCRLVEEDRLTASLESIGADRVVIGHTPTPTRRILTRFGGKVIEVDTGMLNKAYGGSGNALVMEDAEIYVVSEHGKGLAKAEVHPRQAGTRPGGFLSLAATLDLLADGDIVTTRTDESGRQIITVSSGGRQIDAVFARRSGREFFPEAAAFRLDRLLGLDMVPATVVRNIEGKEGSLQFLPPQLMNEATRSSTGRGGSAQCPLEDQWKAMYVFDALIHNEGRIQERMLYDRGDGYQLILNGHERCFSTKSGRPAYLKGVPLDINKAWRTSLAGLDEETVEREFAGVLDKRRRKALVRRSKQLLESADPG